jgi:outer membrane protein assembly factor BamB
MLAVAWGVRSNFAAPAGSATAGTAAAPTPAAPSLPSAEEFARNWPRFRGPDGSGTSPKSDAPVRWDVKSGAGIAWKAEVPAPGYNSPIVWGDRVFVSGATREARTVYCFDTASGRLLWQCPIEPPPGTTFKPPDLAEETGYAASTMATDGRHVYSIFGHGNLAAVTFDGKVAWAKHLGVPRNPYGYATSLAVWQGRVIVQFDQGESEPANSKLLSFDGATGRLVWEKPRPVASSWATPIVVEAAGKTQIIALGPPFVIAYAAGDGAELWRVEGIEGEVAPSPVFAGGLAFVVSPSHKLMAIRPDGTGNVTATHVVWQAEESMPDVTSPVSDGTWALTVTSGGQLLCFDAKDGKKVWEKDLETEVQSSPAIFGNRLYVACTNGTTVVAELGREYRELARNELGEKILASPALVGGRLYLRGLQHLFCLAGGSSAKAPPPAP